MKLRRFFALRWRRVMKLLGALIIILVLLRRRGGQQSLPTKISLVYVTSFYGEVRSSRPTIKISCPVDDSSIDVEASYDMSKTADADGLIYYGPDLYNSQIPPFGFGQAGQFRNGNPFAMPIPLLNFDDPRQNSQVPVFYTEEPSQSTKGIELNKTSMRHFGVPSPRFFSQTAKGRTGIYHTIPIVSEPP